MAAASLQPEQTVLWEGTLQQKSYGEVTREVAFAQPVLVSGIRVSSASADAGLQPPQLLKGHAVDLSTPTAARFSLLFDALSVPEEGVQECSADKAFPTQRVWLRGRCCSVKVQLLGYELDETPQQIKAAAQARFGPLPDASPLLSLPSTPQPQLHPRSAEHGAPSLPRPAGKQLPLGKIPPAFVLTLAPLASFWKKSHKIPLPPGVRLPPAADLCACDGMANAVLAAQRGSPAALLAKLASTRNMRGLAVDWDSIRDRVLDMATYCCSALGDNISDPEDIALATAGVSAAIMLAACQDGAAQFLSWPNGGAGVAGAIAVRDLVSMPNQPGAWQERSMGLVELLLESCPAVAGPTLQGTLNPAGIPEPDSKDMGGAAAAAAEASAGANGAQDSRAVHDSEEEQDGASSTPDAAASVPADEAEGQGGADNGSADAGGTAAPPVAKRQRVAGYAGAPAACTDVDTAADGAAAAAPGSAGLLHAESTTGSAAAAALAGAAAGQQQQPPPPPAGGQQQPHSDGGSDHADNDDALLAGLEHSPDGPGDNPAAARRKRQRQALGDCGDADADGQDRTEPVDSEGWDPDDHDRLTGGGQQDGDSTVQQQQDVAMEEGDYPEADEEAIRAEAAAKAARRCVGRRPPVCTLAKGQLYGAIVQLAMTPMKHAAAVSCMSVLRRLRAYRCLDVLQATVGAWLSDKVDARALTPAELCEQVRQVAAAAQDLAALVLLPPPSDRSLFLHDPPEGQPPASSLLQPQQQQEADYCVLQLLLSFRALELLAAVNCHIGVHVSRLAELQQQQYQRHVSQQHQPHDQQASAQLLQPQQPPPLQSEQPRQQPAPDQPSEPPDPQSGQQPTEQQAQLCREHAQLLASIRALASALTASSGGWSFLTAARDGLAALATAVCPTRQVCLDGGPFSPDTSLPYDHQQGWAAERQALLAAAAGQGCPSEDAYAAGAGDLSDSLQRLWLLVEETAHLQGAEDVLSGKDRTPGAVHKLSAAMKTLFVGGFASEVGLQSLVSALSACSPAVRQLGVLLEHSSQVLAAAAPAQDDQGPGSQGQDRPLNLSFGLRLVHGALYAPEVLLALVSSPHPGAIAAWLPETGFLHDIIREQLNQHDVAAPAAAAAAFPDLLGAEPDALQACGLPTALLPGGAAAANESSEQILLQLHGAVLTAHNLLQRWREGASWAPVGAGSAGKLLDWLHSQLPKLESVVQRSSGVIDPEGVAPKLNKKVSAALTAVQAADAPSQLDGAAAAAGAPPPAGRDVKAEAVVEFMRNAACRSAALCALHLVNMLLLGAPDSVRHTAHMTRMEDVRKAKAKGSQEEGPVAAFVPVWQQDGTVGQGDASDAAAALVGSEQQQQSDGFAVPDVVRELLEGVAVKTHPEGYLAQVEVFELLERALRTATVALRSADADLLWTVRSGSQEDMLTMLEARTAAAALMRAACTTTASLLVHLSDADPQQDAPRLAVENDSLLDALLCAHSAVVTCREGLQACVPHPQLAPFIARATDPSLGPTQRSATDAAVSGAAARVGNSRVLLLLEARQALAVCLRCWQLQGWRPDPVGALLGVFPHASDALETFAKEDAAARQAGDPSAPPSPPPRQGPRQLLSSLLGLADLCPDEWPARGASQAAARHRDAAAAEGVETLEGSPFERPNLISLRSQLALSLEVHWERLQGLVKFGLSCSSRLARLALVRMLTRMCGVGGGTPPELGPLVLAALRVRLESIGMARNGLAAQMVQIKGSALPPNQKQLRINKEVDKLVLEVRGAMQVCEVLLPLCSSPSIKSVLTEHKAALLLGKAVSVLVKPLQDMQQLLAAEAAAAAAGPAPVAGPGLLRLGSEVQVLSGLLLQLVSVLMDPDISMNPWADSYTRELHETPALTVGGKAITWLLSAAEGLNPANMAALAGLLVGPSVAGATRCLYDYPKGRYLLRMAARFWHLLATQAAAGGGMTQADLQLSGEWAAAALESMQCPTGPDATHAASCAAIAQVLRELAATSTQESEQVGQAETTHQVQGTIPRFVAAIKAATAAHRPGGPDTQSVTSLLSSAPLLLACDASCLDFWKASAASAEHLQTNANLHTQLPHSAATAAAPPSGVQDWWPQTQLVGLSTPRVVSRSIMDVTAVAQTEQQQRQQQQQQGRRGGVPVPAAAASANSIAPAGDSAEIPAIMARRGHGPFGKDGNRKISMHVDDFESRQQRRASQHLASPPGQAPHGMGPAGVMPAMMQQPMAAMAMGHAAAAAAAGMGPMGVMPGMGPMGLGGPMGPGPGMAPGPMGQMVPDPSIGTQLLMQHQQMLQQQQAMMMGAGVPGMMQQQQQQQQPQQQQHHRQGRPQRGGRPWRGQH